MTERWARGPTPRRRLTEAIAIGDTFGLLTVVAVNRRLRRKAACDCRCACGRPVRVRTEHLLNRATKSCGHLRQALRDTWARQRQDDDAYVAAQVPARTA